jgi:hypothetical protein
MFNISTCAKCGGSSFKVVLQEPSGSNYKLNFVQCSSCNAPVGVLEYYNTSSQLEKQKKQIENLGSQLSNIEHTLRQVTQAIQALHR